MPPKYSLFAPESATADDGRRNELDTNCVTAFIAQNLQALALSWMALTSNALTLVKKSGIPTIMFFAGIVLSICLAASMNATRRSQAAGSALPQTLPPLSL